LGWQHRAFEAFKLAHYLVIPAGILIMVSYREFIL
jgi:hypothetical protein